MKSFGIMKKSIFNNILPYLIRIYYLQLIWSSYLKYTLVQQISLQDFLNNIVDVTATLQQPKTLNENLVTIFAGVIRYFY